MTVRFKGKEGRLDFVDHDVEIIERVEDEWVLGYEDGRWGVISGIKLDANFYELWQIEEE